MNNILSFDEYNGQELEQMVYDNELNEGLRSFFNKRAARKVRKKLSAEIEMSKSVMDGIKTGLESLNESFEAIRKSLDKTEDKGEKGEKQKLLDSIKDILEQSRKTTWDLKSLINEGEIDYSGFTANLGTAVFINFGILFTPFRSLIIMHKGYNYFFNIIKDTIRKALVMLQLNFDQFENLIIAKSFQSADYLQDMRDFETMTEITTQIQEALFDKNNGLMKNKKTSKNFEKKYQLALNSVKEQMRQKKALQQSENEFNSLNIMDNTYTKSLEVLRQYSQEDVSKHLESIKASITKYAGSMQDNSSLQTFGELVIAAAEEHAYKVSSSIYNKFAKLTEVFSLPNQKKLIDLIKGANEEQEKAAERKRKQTEKDENLRLDEATKKKFEDDGIKVFKTLPNVKIGELDKETYKYSDVRADEWTYEEFEKLSKEDQETLEEWLSLHTEVLEKCDPTLQVALAIPFNDGYIDSLIDYISPCLSGKVNETYILNFDEFLEEGNSSYKEEELRKMMNKVDDPQEIIDKLFKNQKTYTESDIKTLNKLIKHCDNIVKKTSEKGLIEKYTDFGKAFADFKESIEKKTVVKSHKSKKTAVKYSKFYIDFGNISDGQVSYLKDLYENKEIAVVALKVIGKKILKDNTFVKTSEEIVDLINKCFSNDKAEISKATFNILSESIKKLKYARAHDYASFENEEKKSED